MDWKCDEIHDESLKIKVRRFLPKEGTLKFCSKFENNKQLWNWALKKSVANWEVQNQILESNYDSEFQTGQYLNKKKLHLEYEPKLLTHLNTCCDRNEQFQSQNWNLSHNHVDKCHNNVCHAHSSCVQVSWSSSDLEKYLVLEQFLAQMNTVIPQLVPSLELHPHLE